MPRYRIYLDNWTLYHENTLHCFGMDTTNFAPCLRMKQMHKGSPPWICVCTNIDVRYLFNFRNVRNIHRCTLSGFVGSAQAWILNLNLDNLLCAHMSRMIHSNRTTIKVEVTELCLDNRLVIRNSCFAKKRTSDRFGRVVQSVWRRRQQMEVKFAEKSPQLEKDRPICSGLVRYKLHFVTWVGLNQSVNISFWDLSLHIERLRATFMQSNFR